MAQKFLVIDDHADGRSLITRTLLRRFPVALTLDCVDAGTAVETAGSEYLDAIIVHRAGEVPGVELIQHLRRMNPSVPILAISGIDRTKEALAAGANQFLNYDEWLRVGSVIASMLKANTRPGMVQGATEVVA